MLNFYYSFSVNILTAFISVPDPSFFLQRFILSHLSFNAWNRILIFVPDHSYPISEYVNTYFIIITPTFFHYIGIMRENLTLFLFPKHGKSHNNTITS